MRLTRDGLHAMLCFIDDPVMNFILNASYSAVFKVLWTPLRRETHLPFDNFICKGAFQNMARTLLHASVS